MKMIFCLKKKSALVKNLRFLLLKIPPGRVTTYGEVARALGCPHHARYLGYLLSQNRQLDRYPCYKVVRADGQVGGYAGGNKNKIKRLQRDGIVAKGQYIKNWSKIFFRYK